VNRTTRILGPAVLVLVGTLALVAALAFGGGAAPISIGDPGPVARWGLPLAKMFVNLGAAGVIGAIVLALFALGPGRDEFAKTLDFASASAAVLTVASGLTGFFTFLVVTNTPFAIDDDFGVRLGFFLTEVEAGQAWLTTTLLAATVTVLCFAVRNLTALFFVGVLAAVSLLPMAQQGHAAGSAGHDAAITALGLHLLFAAVWLGGLLALVIIRPTLAAGRLPEVLARYSTIALVCFVVVAVSGYASAELRVGSLDRLATPYGLLVVVKVAALVVLGLFGASYRSILLRRMVDSGRERARFWWIAVAELGFMGVASGVAAALARTATPVAEAETAPTVQTPAQVLTDEPLPPELTPLGYITSWNIDILWGLFCAFAIFFYIAGVVRLHRRGDSWPVLRTVSWIAGIVLLFWVTSGVVNVYQQYLFSIHMLGHMLLAMAVPILLVPGAPVTLAMRAIRKRQDDSRGAREWILLAVHSRYATVLSHPIVAAVLFAGSLWVFYFTPVFRWAMTDHIGHQWMIAHFLATGYLFVQSLIGIDPIPHRLSYPLRLFLLLATMASHAFFGLTIMSSHGLFLADWFGAMGRTWGATPMEDQIVGGGIAWSIGEIPTVILAIVVAIQWGRNDTKEQKRVDRAADRDDDAELKEYNARLARLADRDVTPSR
jgi:putative copper resistance protein D